MISLLKTYCRVLFALGLAVAVVDGKGQDTPATPAEQYQALLKEVRLSDAGQGKGAALAIYTLAGRTPSMARVRS